MQQDTYFYQNIPQDPRLQYPNANSYPAQVDPSPWSGNYIPQVNMCQSQNVPIPFSSQLQPNNVTPVSAAVFGSAPNFSWAHTVPSLMPWVTQDDEDVPNPVMRFTAPFPPDPCTSQTATSWELLNNLGANKTNVNMHLKRKSDLDVLEAAPHKMCITEEKMAARLKNLHISNQYSVPSESSPFGPYSSSTSNVMSDKPVTNLQQLEAMIKNSSSDGSSKSLVLAPELKKLVEPDKIFSSTFLEKVERPSMAVVVWQPQNKLLVNENTSDSDTDSDKKEPSHSNNSLSENENNNYLSQQFVALVTQNSFCSATNKETTSSHNSEDIMDT